MAEDFRTQVQDLQRLDPTCANQACAECASPNPQWASVSHGIFICLECSGTHRSLGVHLSFVRSISMDKWSRDQFAKMQLGGNAAFAAYTQQHPNDMGNGIPLKDKYASYPAAVYRAQLAAKVEGKDFDPSSVQWTPPSAPGTASASPAPLNSLNGPTTMVGFGSGTSSPAPNSQSAFGNGLPTKDQNEDYFARMGQANMSRPEHLPPSQGGRYTGFGSTPTPSASSQPATNPFASPFSTLNPAAIANDPMAALSKGWSLFSTVATAAASTVGTVVVKGTQLVQDPNFQSTVQSQVARGATTVGELLTKVGETAMATGTRAYTLLEQQRLAAAAGGGSAGPAGGYAGVDQQQGGMWGAHGQHQQQPANAFGGQGGGSSDFFSQQVPSMGMDMGTANGSGSASPFRSASPPLPPQHHQETLIGGAGDSTPSSMVASVSGASAMQRKGTGAGAAAKKSDDWDEW
ncbi:hypothetical protein BCR44DRAFT_1466760 [Catenaria anguillulae PL171]|uniref:Arf-GAP domain-containing protein n=1 Tax=Catenaria anguillulae PL171 TaxID=765915 RepID=A0A1Y2H4E2_9FUNG|nr:hypothetical protein BCR44DRAFT_1466760 [Catenaria anguillulae PL171]